MEQQLGCFRRVLVITVILVLNMRAGEAILAPLEFLALQSIKKSMQDMPGSTYFSSGWDFSKDPCSFPGIVCSSNAQEPQTVIALNLGDPSAGSPGLKGRLSGEIGLLMGLVEFTVVPGQVTGSIPEVLSQLKELQFLGLSKNYLTGHIPQGLSYLRNLRTLDLSYNQLHGSIPQGLANVPLSNLILGHNKLSGSISDLDFPATLARLDLKHNSLSGSLPARIPQSLQYFSVSHNSLSGGIGSLTGLQQLSYLDMSFNDFNGNVPTLLLELPQLSSLQLQRNSFSGSIAPTKQVAAQTLDLSHNTLQGQISPFLVNVQNLYLNNNHFTGAVPEKIVSNLLAGSIQVLYLQHNYLDSFPISTDKMLPLSASLCAQYNCMIPPVQSHCPTNVGKQKRRPVYQCNAGFRHKHKNNGRKSK